MVMSIKYYFVIISCISNKISVKMKQLHRKSVLLCRFIRNNFETLISSRYDIISQEFNDRTWEIVSEFEGI